MQYRVCPVCGTDHGGDDRFCGYCGAPLAGIPLVSGHACPDCGQSNPPGFNHCGRCGVRLPVNGQAFRPLAAPNAWGEGEQRGVAVLFADISNFTALAARMEPEDVYLLVRRCIQLLDEAVRRYDGFVDKHTGDGIMALFGAPVAHENDAERAVLAALDMQAALRGLNQQQRDRRQPTLGLRIGLHYGQVVAGNVGSDAAMDYTAVGDTVNMAARLQQTASPGSVVVSQAAYQATATLFEFRPMLPLNLKGYTEPVSAWEVLGVRPARGRLRGVPQLQGPLVGRADELRRLREALERLATEGQGQAIIVSGEAGLGKTKLVNEALHAASSHAWRVLEGACLAHTASISYHPFAAMLRDYFGLPLRGEAALLWRTVRERLEPLGLTQDERYLVPLLALLGLSVPAAHEEWLAHLTPPQLQTHIFLAVRDLLAAEAARQPVVVVVDDLHWSDELSLELLVFLLDTVKTVPLALVALARPMQGVQPLKLGPAATAKLGERYLHIRLSELSDDETAALLANLLAAADLPDDFRQAILRRAAGNPFYLEEILRMLLDQGVLGQGADGRWQLRADADLASLAVPPTLQGLIMARFDRLPPPARRALQVASVVGYQVPELLLRAVLGNLDGLDTIFAELVRLSFLVVRRTEPEPVFFFTHTLVQEAIYHSLLHQHRRQLHQQVAEAIERLYAGRLDDRLEELAQHYLNSLAHAKALHYVLICARRAALNFAMAHARALYEQAEALLLEVPDVPPEQRVAAFSGLADVLMLIGEYEEARDHYRTALRWLTTSSDDWLPEDAAALQRKIAGTYEAQGALEETLSWLGAALSSLAGQETPAARLEQVRIFSDQGWAWLHLDDHDEAERWLHEALALALAGADAADVTASVYNRLSGVAFRRGQLAQAIQHEQQGLALQERAGDMHGMANTYANLGLLHRLHGDWTAALSYYRRAQDILEYAGDTRGLAWNCNALGLLHLHRGDLTAARQVLARGWEQAERIGYVPAQARLRVSLAELAWREGDAEEALRQLADAQTLGNLPALPEEAVAALCLRSAIHAARGVWDVALAEAEQALAIGRALGETSEPAARALYALGEAHRHRGNLDAAATYLDDARDRWRALHQDYELAQCLFARAKVAEAQGHMEQATAWRQQAGDIFRALGAAPA